MNQTAIVRIAAATNALRPDWPNASVVTLLTKHLAGRAYRDVAVAMAWVATDPDSQTPARVLEQGPWWTATGRGDTPRTPDNSVAGKCPRCPAWTVPGDGHQCTPAEPTDEYRQAREALRTESEEGE